MHSFWHVSSANGGFFPAVGAAARRVEAGPSGPAHPLRGGPAARIALRRGRYCAPMRIVAHDRSWPCSCSPSRGSAAAARDRSSSGGGPTRKLAPVAAQGAVSVATRNTTRLGGADAAADAAAVARAVYPGLTPATRPQAVVLVDEHDWPAALAASVLSSAPLGAPILYSEGDTLPAVSRQTLEAMHPLGAPTLGGAQVIRIGTSAAVPGGYLTRTAAASARRRSRRRPSSSCCATLDRGSAPRQVIVLAADARPALAMPAAGLAAESGAPILFVTPARRARRRRPPCSPSLHRPSIYVIDAVGGRPTHAGRARAASARSRRSRAGPRPGRGRRSRPERDRSGPLHRRHVRLGGQRTRPRSGVRERGAPARRPRRRPALGDRRLRTAAAAGERHPGPAGARALPRRHPARVHERPAVPAGPRRLQSRLADRRRTGDLRGHPGRNRLPARDHARARRRSEEPPARRSNRRVPRGEH